MSLRIAGMGWVTPLGRGVESVWNRLLNGEEAVAQPISDSVSNTVYPAFRVPADALKDLPASPRLRRASSISRFAAAAGVDAVAQARSTIPKIDPDRMALVLAVSNGGVIYTKRFYNDIVRSGTQSASPLLFPETVFNAPASHLAAILGINGTSYTIVGDGAVGILAIKMAQDLLQTDALDSCLVVGAEEADWILCDAYQKWRLIKKNAPIQLFCDPPRGTILSEGAGAIVLSRDRGIKIDAIEPGENFSGRNDAAEILKRILRELRTEHACIVCSANGTFVDPAEQKAIQSEAPEALVYSLKAALGESVGASALWQVIAAGQILLTKRLPQIKRSSSIPRLNLPTAGQVSCRNTIVLSCGLNQQAAGLSLAI
jgi:3-oxoacyl-(acyl-carrier-protein) synthase